jgi:excinuclease UvrABC ATPase subunit
MKQRDRQENMTEFIEIRGARENNLQNVSVRIPKRKLTISIPNPTQMRSKISTWP